MNVLSIAVNVVSSDDCRGKWTPDSCCFIVGNCVVNYLRINDIAQGDTTSCQAGCVIDDKVVKDTNVPLISRTIVQSIDAPQRNTAAIGCTS